MFHASTLRKNTSVDWIGSIPSAWEVKPLKHIAQFMNGMAFKPSEWTEVGTPIIRIENLNGSEQFNGFSGRVDPRYHVSAGDLLFGWSGNIGTSFGPFIWSRPRLHYLNQHIFKVTPDGCSPQWLYWCLMAVTDYVEQQAHGIIGMVHVTRGKLGAALVPVPPLCEQCAIADFLDRETAKIDALIAAQERLIALLDEKRQATITHVVTKGVDPTAPMKESGVEWLGKVPANWGVLPLKRCCRIPNGLVDPTVSRYAALPLIAPNHIQSGTGRLLELETADDQGAISGKYHFAEGTVLYSKIRPALRKACVAPFEGLCSADMYPIHSTKIMPRLLLYQLLSDCFSSFAILSSDRVAMPKVNRETIGDFPMVVLPSAEQEVIVRYVDEAVAEIDHLRDRSVEVIERLRERRTALITAAVTGQIDVTRPAITEAAE